LTDDVCALLNDIEAGLSGANLKPSRRIGAEYAAVVRRFLLLSSPDLAHDFAFSITLSLCPRAGPPDLHHAK
jgi:hypothetical protein